MPLKLCQVEANYCDDHDDNDADDEDDGIDIAANNIESFWAILVLILCRHHISVSGKLVAGIDFKLKTHFSNGVEKG